MNIKSIFKASVTLGIVTFSLLLFTGNVDATTWTVDDSGKANYARIQDAINNARVGDTIFVYSGTYYENVDVNKELTLLGIDNGGGKPIVNGGKNYSVIAVTLDAGWSTLDGFIFKYAGTGIHVNSNDNIIRNNTVLNNGYGIYILNSYNNMLIGNAFKSNREGIYLYNSSNNMLIGNTVSDNEQYGIILHRSGFEPGLDKENNGNNTFYNNFFNNYNNLGSDYTNKWNSTETRGINIVGGPYIGGNVWADPRGTGFSQTCENSNSDGICDTPYKLESPPGITNIDHLPLAYKPATTNLMNILFMISLLAVALTTYLRKKEIEINKITSSVKDVIKGAIFGTVSGGIIGFVLLIAITVKGGGYSDVMLGGLMYLVLGMITGAITGIIGYACKDAVVGAIFGAVVGMVFGSEAGRIDLIVNVPAGAFVGTIIGSIIAGAFFGKNKNAMTGTIVSGTICGMFGSASFSNIIGGFIGGALFGATVGSIIGGIFIGRLIGAIASNRNVISGVIAGAISGSFGGLITGIIFGPSLSSIVIWIIGPVGGAIIGAIFGMFIRKSNNAIRRVITGGLVSGAIFGVISSEIVKFIDTGTIADAILMMGLDAIFPVILCLMFGAIVGATSNYSFLRTDSHKIFRR